MNRITSAPPGTPPCNPCGVPYHVLLAVEREANAELAKAYQAALRKWEECDDAISTHGLKNGMTARLRREARELSAKALS
jgi:hypothetical protein